MTQGSSDLALPAKRKHMMASKLTSEENTYMDMVKKKETTQSIGQSAQKDYGQSWWHTNGTT